MMKPPLPIVVALCVAVSLFSLSSARAADKATGPVRVLFLGDNDHHRPPERFKLLEPVMAERDIEVVYTDSMDDLNAGKLAEFDCLLIYANVTEISPEQEQAMLDFVEAGGGLVPIHCASYCFLNSPKYIELVGAQFKRHGKGVFTETIVAGDHPVMEGLEAIESWDETYVHTKHNTNRVILAERRDDRGAEPWTWVRDHGEGRVFYTAWGHDERTWSKPGFHALVESGIRWSAANSPRQLRPRTGLKPFEFIPTDTPVPNYLPSRQGQEQLGVMQRPLEPAESAKHLVTRPVFEVSLFASEPEIVNPIWLAWDARGRLWTAETVDYPNQLQPEGEGRDRIRIIEDTNGDGHADKFTVFVGQLSIPTGFVFANGGVIVIHSGRTEFFRDTDGDDRADERRVLFEGWNMHDTHATASNLRYGFDNWIWGTVGYSGFEGTVGGKSLRFGQGFFRFKPDGSVLEFVRSSNNNTWGLGLTEDNLVFGSTANNNASMYMPIANRYYESVNGWSAARLETIADSQRIYPLTDRVRQVDAHGRYTAGSGSAIYTARAFPRAYWNRVQFVSAPTGHLLGQFALVPNGTDFVAKNGGSIVASDDEWTAPICAEVGPDGALWMIDWYNYIVQHNPTPQGFETGKGAAYETPLRDKTRGRIYRIAQKGRSHTAPPGLDQATPQELVSALKQDNMLWRMHGQRLLVERDQQDVVPELCDLVGDTSVDAIGLNASAIHALWTLDGLGAFEAEDSLATQAALAALKHPSAGVRRAAVTVLQRSEASHAMILSGGLLEDVDAQVRMAALLKLSELPPDASAGSAVFAMLQEPRNARDRWIPDAVTAAAAQHDSGFLQAALASTNMPMGIGPVISVVTAHYARRGPVDSIVATLTGLSTAPPMLSVAVLDGLRLGWPEGVSPELSVDDREQLAEVMRALPVFSRDRLLVLARRWGQPELFGTSLAGIVEMLTGNVADASLSSAERSSAARRLMDLEDTPEVWALLLQQVNLLTPPDLAIGLINALGESRVGVGGRRDGNRRSRGFGEREPGAADALLAHWSDLTPSARRAAVTLLMRRLEWSVALLRAVEDGEVSKSDLAAEHWAQLMRSPNRFVARRSQQLAGEVNILVTGREEMVSALLPLASEPGDAERGAEVFKANCVVCHQFNGEGNSVGPDLNGIGARARSEILQEILDPNRSVEANYRAWSVETKDGELYTGRLESETQTSIELLDTTAQKHVFQRSEIDSLTVSSLSLMPEGFEALPAEDVKGLIEYLSLSHEPIGSP